MTAKERVRSPKTNTEREREGQRGSNEDQLWKGGESSENASGISFVLIRFSSQNHRI